MGRNRKKERETVQPTPQNVALIRNAYIFWQMHHQAGSKQNGQRQNDEAFQRTPVCQLRLLFLRLLFFLSPELKSFFGLVLGERWV
jgi:hypothetical protein